MQRAIRWRLLAALLVGPCLFAVSRSRAQSGTAEARLTFPEHFPLTVGHVYTYRGRDANGNRFTYRVEVGAEQRLPGADAPVIPWLYRTSGSRVRLTRYFQSDAKEQTP